MNSLTNIGAQIDDLTKLKLKHKKARDVADAIEKEVKAQEEQLQALLIAQGMEKAGGKTATVALRKSIVASVKDWEVFLAYIYKTKAGHLLQRRVSDPAVRELFETKGKVPGVEPFEKMSLSYTAVK